MKTRHILLLAAEAVIVPVTGLAALLPGPNIIFYVLAILMIIQWQALRGIDRILGKEYEFVADPLLTEWEAAVEARDTSAFPGPPRPHRKDPRPPLPPQTPLEIGASTVLP